MRKYLKIVAPAVKEGKLTLVHSLKVSRQGMRYLVTLSLLSVGSKKWILMLSSCFLFCSVWGSCSGNATTTQDFLPPPCSTQPGSFMKNLLENILDWPELTSFWMRAGFMLLFWLLARDVLKSWKTLVFPYIKVSFSSKLPVGMQLVYHCISVDGDCFFVLRYLGPK